MRNHLLLLVVLLVLAFGLRIARLGEQAVWWDEAWSVHVAQQSFAQVTEITSYDVQPPLYQWTLFAWIRGAGISELAVRYLSVLWGVLTVALVYVLTTRISNRRAGSLAAFFIALSAFHINWSQETRMYAQAAFFTALTCYAYLRVYDRNWHAARGWWIVVVFAGAAIPLSHYLGGFVLAILSLHWLAIWRTHSRAFRRGWIGAMLLIAVILGAWGLYARDHIRSGGGDFDAPADFVFRLAATLWATGSSVDLHKYTWPTLAVIAGLGIGLALYTHRNRFAGSLVWLGMLCPPLIIYVLSQISWRYYAPKPEARYLVIFAPLVYVGFGLALDSLRLVRRYLGIIAAIGLLMLYGAAYLRDLDDRYFRDDYASMLRMVDLLAAPDEPVFFVSDDRYPLVYYNLDRAAGGHTSLQVSGIPLPVTDLAAHMRAVIGDADRFWFVEIERNLSDPQGESIAWLDQHFERVYHVPIDYNAVSLYSQNNLRPPESTQTLPPPIREARPGDTVRIGVPDGTVVDLIYDGQVIASQVAQGWQLLQFPIYRAYPPGEYRLRTSEAEYHFRVTHSQPTPEGIAPNLNVPIGPLRLVGYTIDRGHVHPGEAFAITLYWQVEQRPAENYTVFFHLLGPENPVDGSIVWATDDSYPAQTPPLALWRGQVISDHRRLRVPENMSPGWYSAEAGLYLLETSERLLLPDGSDRVLIPGLEVRR